MVACHTFRCHNMYHERFILKKLIESSTWRRWAEISSKSTNVFYIIHPFAFYFLKKKLSLVIRLFLSHQIHIFFSFSLKYPRSCEHISKLFLRSNNSFTHVTNSKRGVHINTTCTQLFCEYISNLIFGCIYIYFLFFRYYYTFLIL